MEKSFRSKQRFSVPTSPVKKPFPNDRSRLETATTKNKISAEDAQSETEGILNRLAGGSYGS
jgi:hypothetical protein